jgi:hypothetical protein
VSWAKLDTSSKQNASHCEVFCFGGTDWVTLRPERLFFVGRNRRRQFHRYATPQHALAESAVRIPPYKLHLTALAMVAKVKQPAESYAIPVFATCVAPTRTGLTDQDLVDAVFSPIAIST